MWELPQQDYSWATAGYQGAISSGNTTCGLLIGGTIAIGLRSGQGKEVIPVEDKETRAQAIAEVNEFYRDFLGEFNNTICKELINLDFSKPGEGQRYAKEEVYKDTCFKYFNFIMDRFIERDKSGL